MYKIYTCPLLGGKMKKNFILSISVLITLLMLTSCGTHLGLSKVLGSGSSPTKTAKVKPVKETITSAGYDSNNLQVKVGTAVKWTNTDTAPHTVTSDTAGVFDSGPIAPKANFSFTFKQAGTFTYHSTGDTSITGTVVVAP